MTDEPQRGQETDDLWSWIDQEDLVSDAPEIPASDVTAVMVVHNAADWLPRQLLSLARLSPRPGRLIAVDTGSADESPALLARALDEGVLHEVITLGPEVGFGEAVGAALSDREPEWIWLLHDDSAPHKDALAHLVEGARHTDLVVPKLLEPKRRNYPETIAEIGQAITPGGIRVPLTEPGDIDQHQSESRDVLGGSTAGMLIRGETWREVGGIAPEVGRHRDGVDLGWRTNAVGYRVLTWPAAALNHLQAGREGLRGDAAHPHVSDRLAALRIAGSRGASGPGLFFASVARAIGFLIAKSPGHASAELKALRRYRATPEQTAALAARLPEEDLTPEDLLPNRFWPLRHAVDRIGSGISDRYRSLTDAAPETSIDELTSDDYAGPAVRRKLLSPVTLLVVVLLVAAGIAARTLLGDGPVSGGGLLAAPRGLAAAWQAYLSGTSPWVGLAAVSSLAGFGSPGWFAFLAIVLTPLLAALSALALLRRFDVALPLACGASAAWAGGTILLGLVSAGDVTGMVLAVTGPLFVRAVHAMLVDRSAGAEALRAPAGVAFWLVVIASVWPVALPAVTVAAIALVATRRAGLARVLVAVLPAWLYLIPWLPTLVRHPGRLLTGVDPLAWPDYPPASYALVVGRILPSGLPLWANLAFFGVLGLTAVAALARLGKRRWVACVVALAAPLLIGTLLSRVVVAVDGGVTRPLLSPWALLVLAALIAPVVALPKASAQALRAMTIALGAAGALAVGVWAVVGFNGPVRSIPSVLPGYVRDVLTSTRDTRALAIQVGEGERVAWNVIDARQPQWGTGERNPIGSFDRQFASIAYSIAAGDPPVDLAERLQLMGVSHVYVGGVEGDQRAALDNLAGLVSNPADDRSTVWTVSGQVSRLSTDGEQQFIADDVVAAGAEGRSLILAESGSSGWTAKLDGKPLPRLANTEAPLIEDSLQSFGPIPAAGGTVQVEPAAHWWQLWLQAFVMLGIALCAAPTLGGSAVARRGQ